MDFIDYVFIVFKSVILTLIVAPLIIGAIYLMQFNFYSAYFISDALDIPRDLALTITSAGFANNIIILMTVFEFGIGLWLIDKLTKTNIYNNFKDFVMDL